MQGFGQVLSNIKRYRHKGLWVKRQLGVYIDDKDSLESDSAGTFDRWII